MNGMRWAYLRETAPSTPSVEATALQPPSIASFDDLCRIEIDRVRREARAGAVLDPLIDGQDAEVARAAEATVIEQLAQVPERRGAAVGVHIHAVDEVRPRDVQQRLIDRLAAVAEQIICIVTEQIRDEIERRLGRACHY